MLLSYYTTKGRRLLWSSVYVQKGSTYATTSFATASLRYWSGENPVFSLNKRQKWAVFSKPLSRAMSDTDKKKDQITKTNNKNQKQRSKEGERIVFPAEVLSQIVKKYFFNSKIILHLLCISISSTDDTNRVSHTTVVKQCGHYRSK